MKKDSKPWYKQFWPWFIISIPATSVVAGIVMVTVAIKGGDTLVKDDWYKDGMAINKRLDKQNKAKEEGFKAFFSYDPQEQIVRLQIQNMDAAKESTLFLDLMHPTQAQKDIRVELFRTPENDYFAKLTSTPNGFYYAQLHSAQNDWVIDSKINFENSLSNFELN